MARRTRRACVVGGLLATLLGARFAGAHADLDPLHDHRILSLHLTDGGIVATYVLAFSAATSEDLRRAADANHDGRLTDDELGGLSAHLLPLAQGLRLDLDGVQTFPLTSPPRYEGAVGEVIGPREIAARWEQRIFPTTTHEHRFAVADATKLPRPGDLHVRISGEGQSRVLGVDHRVESRLSFLEAAFHRQDACQSATCAVEVRFLGGGLAPKPGLPWPAGLLVLAFLVSLAAYAYRRQKAPVP